MAKIYRPYADRHATIAESGDRYGGARSTSECAYHGDYSDTLPDMNRIARRGTSRGGFETAESRKAA
jgi:hypothetical protein